MNEQTDPRLAATRAVALEAALNLLQDEGVLAVTHGAISAKTGISRSTLYRHWPKLSALRNDAFLRAATAPSFPPMTDGPLRTDLETLLGKLMMALNETPWGRIAPQVIALAATDGDARALINGFMSDRIGNVDAAFEAAKARGEIRAELDVRPLIEVAIAVPYFRKLVAGLPLDEEWLQAHVDLVCRLAAVGE